MSLVNYGAAQPAAMKSLAETHSEGFQFFAPEEGPTGRGCLLQIYPAGIHAQMIRLKPAKTLIGRDLSSDVALEDTAVSRTHAAIDFENGVYFLSDLASRNGTFVDDKLLRNRTRLDGGELIRVGGTILKFMASTDEEAQYHAVVHELMTRDPLTNAFNRSFLMSLLDRILPRSRSCEQKLSLIMIDIDHFKKVNDSFGHLVGDEVLRIFSERLRNVLRASDVLCRMGGEEFLVISEATSLQDAVRAAERLRLAISSLPFQTQAGLMPITCSLGVAELTNVGAESVDQLIASADSQLYVAKKAGRNCVRSNFDHDTKSPFR